MDNYFKISEFIIDPEMQSVPIHVANKILAFHLPILNPIRVELGVPVIISKHSGYRSIEWEKRRGRSGDSQHTFQAKGAVDITSNEKFDELLELLKASNYTRVCYYPNRRFIHCDFKLANGKQYFVDYGNGWEFQQIRKS